MHLSVVSSSITIRPSNEAMKVVNLRRLRQALRYFFFFSLLDFSRQLLGGLEW